MLPWLRTLSCSVLCVIWLSASKTTTQNTPKLVHLHQRPGVHVGQSLFPSNLCKHNQHADYKSPPLSSSMIMLDIFQTGVTSIWWRKWFMETSPIITVTGQIRGHPYYYKSCTSKHPTPFPQSLPKTHIYTHTHSPFLAVLHFLSFYFLELVKKNNCQYIWPIADFVSGISLSYLVKYWKQPVSAKPDPEWKLKVVPVYYSTDASESDSGYSQTIYTHTNYYKYTILSFHTPTLSTRRQTYNVQLQQAAHCSVSL